MAAEELYTRAGGYTIMQLGPATAANYRRSAKMTRALLARTQDKAERGLIGGMISDCEYAAEWLETGRRPGNRRGIERRSAYQRTRPVDPIMLQQYVRTGAGTLDAIQAPQEGVSDEDRVRIDNVLDQLTARERDAYVMVIGQGLPFAEAARIRGVEKGSIQSLVESARAKISRMMMQGDLFDFN